jgi:hypothetical protein
MNKEDEQREEIKILKAITEKYIASGGKIKSVLPISTVRMS